MRPLDPSALLRVALRFSKGDHAPRREPLVRPRGSRRVGRTRAALSEVEGRNAEPASAEATAGKPENRKETAKPHIVMVSRDPGAPGERGTPLRNERRKVRGEKESGDPVGRRDSSSGALTPAPPHPNPLPPFDFPQGGPEHGRGATRGEGGYETAYYRRFRPRRRPRPPRARRASVAGSGKRTFRLPVPLK